ncbi:TrbC/VirB2 family protein [Rickettsiella endosymbiont of Dermanyssus gallinae]|uniref:TrbC/VirB2 family protein n=1 Tax=Rickettsiella endosymbiont of Dermanyssus gallinae TaxID=2856608 RepID=UPI001C5302F3|nr:TrbC/VirB2 family protein [Rickettsiella endosymbiont of Dermanyssus gallinae]
MSLRKGKKRRFKLIYLALSLFLFFPSLSWAYGGETPVSQGLSYIIDAIFGTTGIALATVSVFGVGIACAYHYFEWKIFWQTLLGISVMFGADGAVRVIHSLLH